jgi:hypothetical protein
MFVAQDLTIDVEPRAAQARFANLLSGNWLAGVSVTAYDGGLTGLLRVGPAGPPAAKLVRVHVLDPVYRGEIMRTGMRWEAAGPAGGLFPVLDADITIAPADERGAPAPGPAARLVVAGAYRPPLGRLGAGLDRVVLHRVATATVRHLLHGVAQRITDPAAAAQPADHAIPDLRPLPETGMP